MSKSILIIDTPKCCRDCQFFFSNISWYCLDNEEFTDKELVETATTDFSKDKPSFCPLKQLPISITKDNQDLEVWSSQKGHMLAPKGLFNEIYNDKEDDDEGNW